MSFARHQTFYLRAGWLAKAVELLPEKPRLFSLDTATTELGIGKNMVQALRFWVRAAGVVDHKPDRDGGLSLSPFGQLVKEFDPYFEHELTWWLIHVNIASNRNEATAWHYLFNDLNAQEFDNVVFVSGLEAVAQETGEISRSSLLKDYDCIRATYVAPRSAQGTPEDNILCPLTRLGLLEEMQSGALRKVHPQRDVPSSVFYHVALTKAQGTNRLNVEQLADGEGSPARLFNLTVDSVYRYLDQLRNNRWVDYSRTAGIDTVALFEPSSWCLITAAYRGSIGVEKHAD